MNVLTFRMQIKQICGKQTPFTHTARILQTGKNKKKYCIGTSFHIKQFIANYLNAIIKSVRLLSGGRPSFLRRR